MKISNKTTPKKRTRTKHYKFLSPKKELVEAYGLRELCQKHGLNPSHMSKVASRKAVHHKGWMRHWLADVIVRGSAGWPKDVPAPE